MAEESTDSRPAAPRRGPAQNAQLALLLEVAGTPKPGNVDRRRDYDDLRLEHFMAGAVGAMGGLAAAADTTPGVGECFERAVAGMAEQSAGNTQFGALLLLVPLVRAAATSRLTPAGTRTVVESTTVEDACGFYRAFEHVDVAVDDPPADADALDVRRGGDAAPELRERALTLADVMALSADRDGVAAELTGGFERSFTAASWLSDDDGPIYQRASRTFLRLLADEPDTFVVTRNGRAAAEEATARAQAVLEGREDADDLAAEFVDRDINPGTTADITAAALFIALQRGLEV
ncbi:triphosphoribosyl-dephospho-CoA synthase [Natronomonas pharaonis DSM 2160]|uniref:Triphosphoribosyl-dephospho-CoA synthase n=1 Tax=Natronomonas pharaonis (strain ATCC 35678 / DSM 2160 / CIP 103997 / JCM 8858 / NBRC 14720 / NCIMB 2260 / Gabara) TaxID=348780 RepID=A0A1U7EVN7_NATPD|nr:triphosphoribosyl-dephospho-CoA synthase [Natronomonas pharaonis]CAI49103.1 triphosphoribosyl-dephospho-CoA synthase [Natronomonas pharaonis DSM 2160]